MRSRHDRRRRARGRAASVAHLQARPTVITYGVVDGHLPRNPALSDEEQREEAEGVAEVLNQEHPEWVTVVMEAKCHCCQCKGGSHLTSILRELHES